MLGKRNPAALTLTDVELELMTILWRIGEGTVNDVLDNLPADRQLAYTSVATVLRILQDKRFLKVRKEGRAHVFIPAVPKEKYETASVRHLVQGVFDGAPTELVRCLVGNERLSRSELSALRAMIDEAERKRR